VPPLDAMARSRFSFRPSRKGSIFVPGADAMDSRQVIAKTRALGARGITVTVYSTSLSSGSSRPVYPCARGFGPGLPGARARPSRRSSAANPFRRPKRSSDGGRPFDSSRRRRVGRCCEKCSKIGDQRAQGPHRCQLVILAREMCADARPWPVLGTAHQRRDHRIERDVTHGRQQVRRAHHHRTEAALERPWNRWPV
jgi:hypothetical protein